MSVTLSSKHGKFAERKGEELGSWEGWTQQGSRRHRRTETGKGIGIVTEAKGKCTRRLAGCVGRRCSRSYRWTDALLCRCQPPTMFAVVSRLGSAAWCVRCDVPA